MVLQAIPSAGGISSHTASLAIDRLLIHPDLRGYGESLWRGPAGIEDWSQDIAELLQQEQKARAIIVGHYLGANVALNFASRFPDKCAGLVLIEPIAREAVTSILARFRSLIVPVLHLIVAVIKLLNRGQGFIGVNLKPWIFDY